MSPPDLTPAAAKSRPLVLVIDDDPSVHKVLGRYLDGLGLEAAVADDGQAGLDFLAMHEVALVCVDLMLPTKSGFAVCETVRHGWKWHRYAAAGHQLSRSSLEARAQAEEVGANGYLVKPFRRAEFENQVRRLLKSRASFLAIDPARLRLCESPRRWTGDSHILDEAEFIDTRALRDSLSLLWGAVRRHLLAAGMLFVLVFGGTVGLLRFVPRTYHTEVRILAQRNLVMPALGNPKRAVPIDSDTPTRAVSRRSSPETTSSPSSSRRD